MKGRRCKQNRSGVSLQDLPIPDGPQRIKYAKTPALQQDIIALHQGDPIPYQRRLQRIQSSGTFDQWMIELARARRRNNFKRIFYKDDPNRPDPSFREDLEQEYQLHLIEFEETMKQRKLAQAQEQKKKMDQLRDEFQDLKARNLQLRCQAGQLARNDVPHELIQRMKPFTKTRKLTKLDASRSSTDWNNLWEVPKRKLPLLINSTCNAEAIERIETSVEHDFEHELFLEFRKRVMIKEERKRFANQRRKNLEAERKMSSRPVTRSLQPAKPKARKQSINLDFYARPKIKRNHPEWIGYDFGIYTGLIFDDELLPDHKDAKPRPSSNKTPLPPPSKQVIAPEPPDEWIEVQAELEAVERRSSCPASSQIYYDRLGGINRA